MKNLYTNVPLKEAIDIALKKLYEQDEPPSIAGKNMKRMLNMAVSQVHFKCNETWYGQKDGLAMGASLAVILANLMPTLVVPNLVIQHHQELLPNHHLASLEVGLVFLIVSLASSDGSL